jgi:hypothetical protein
MVWVNPEAFRDLDYLQIETTANFEGVLFRGIAHDGMLAYN